ncbi:hypothetical protein ACI796_04000 [Geodermatophilus sp. SYSU D00525]
MDRTGPTAERRGRTRLARGLAATAAAAVVALTPGVAAAAPDRSDPPDVVPLVDCVVRHADGTWTAVFGYDNRTGETVEIPVGPANQVTPAPLGEPQPTTFAPGVRHAVFTVTVGNGGGPMWHLGSTNLAARKADPACPPATQMPAEGNGAGLAIGVAVAGGVGAVLLRRLRRRTA